MGTVPELIQAPRCHRSPGRGKSHFLASPTDMGTFRACCSTSLAGELQPFETCCSLRSHQQGGCSGDTTVLPLPTPISWHRMGPAAGTPLRALFWHLESQVARVTESAAASQQKAAFLLGGVKESWAPSTSSGRFALSEELPWESLTVTCSAAPG